MSHIALVRIDDRLIHGQVVVKWLRHLNCKDILIVDDDLAHDDFMQNVLRLAAPPDVRVRVASVQEATRQASSLSNNGHSVLILVKAPQTALALLSQGMPFSELNVGGLAGGPGSTRLYKSVSATAEQIAALLTIQNRGVHVYLQMVPEERPVEITEILPVYTTRKEPYKNVLEIVGHGYPTTRHHNP